MSQSERIEAVRAGMIDERSFSQIAAPLGTTKNAIIGFAFRKNITVRNASYWTATLIIKRPKKRYERRTTPFNPVVALRKRRAKLMNKATDPELRALIDRVNSIQMSDDMITAELGVNERYFTQIRHGWAKPSAFMFGCIDELCRRYGK